MLPLLTEFLRQRTGLLTDPIILFLPFWKVVVEV